VSDQPAIVIIECDRCHREVAMLVVNDAGRVVLDGPRVTDLAADDSDYWRTVIASPSGHTYRPRGAARWAALPGRRMRPGAYILNADIGMLERRVKLICVGRRHGVYERTVTGIEATYARAEGRDARIGMRDVHP
jgi:hypothetical protein